MRALIELGAIKADSKGNYNPGAKATRGQFASYIAIVLNLPSGTHRFDDVPVNSTIAAQISAAVNAGIISGYSAKEFKPDQLITREQMALMINRALTHMKVEKKQASLNFTDQNQIKATASREAIATMIGLHIVSGYKNKYGNGYSFKPFQNITIAESSAFIYRMLQLVPVSEPQPEPVIEPTPTPELTPVQPPSTKDTYLVGTVDSSGKVTASSKTFATFEEAGNAITNEAAQVILYNDKIMKMSAGITFTTPSSGYTTLYSNEKLSTVYGGVAKANELEYVTSDADKVTVKVAGKVVYVPHSQVTLYPQYQNMKRNYYTVNGTGDLLLKKYNHTTQAYVSTSTVGKAPSSFAVNGEYYSWDGATFTNKDGRNMGTYYQYFNMLPIRTSTNYTADELDAFSESDFGMSEIAQTKNNLFGIQANDNDLTAAKTYSKANDSIIDLSNSYVNKKYVPLTGIYANGGVLGNKARGINVRYATDPYWGQIIAGYMYQLDKAMDGKDFLNNPNAYVLYETTTDTLDVRSTPEQTATNKLFTYPKPGYIVTALETSGEWSKILSDDQENTYAYVFSDYIKPLPIAR